MSKTLHLYFFLVLYFLLTGFNLDNSIIPTNEILSGGPPKDGIPALLKPQFVNSSEAIFLTEKDQVIGIKIGSIAKAYPIKILNHHEVVNDTIKDVHIAVTF